MDGLGQPIHVLSLALKDEYRLFASKPSETIAPDIQPWVHKYLLAWAETAAVGLAKQRHPVIIELKARATPVRVRQYPMSQEARWGITPTLSTRISPSRRMTKMDGTKIKTTT